MLSLTRRHLLAALALPAGAHATITTTTAPELTLAASDGLPVLAAEPQARATWLDFWASWCTPCRLSFPWMNEMHQRHAAAGLRVVAVNLDRRDADAQRFLQQQPARFALAFDPSGASARTMDVQAMPSSWLIGRSRRVVMAHRGFRLEVRAELERRILEALK